MKMDKSKKAFEMSLCIVAIYGYWLLYVPIGTLMSLNHVNNAKHLLTRLDYLIPYISFPIVAYQLAFLVIPAALITIFLIKYNEIAIIRGILFSFFILMTTGYIIDYFFPVSVILYKSIPDQIYDPGLLNKWVRISYERISPWNSFPSMHIATSWFTLRLFKKFDINRIVCYLFCIWFLIMVAGTLTLQYHSIADVVLGFFIAECCYQLALKYSSYFSMNLEKISYVIRIIFLIMLSSLIYFFIYYAKINGLFMATLPPS